MNEAKSPPNRLNYNTNSKNGENLESNKPNTHTTTPVGSSRLIGINSRIKDSKVETKVITV